MSLQSWVLAVLVLATAVALARLWRAHRRDPRGPRAWRLAVLLALQPLLAGALYLALFPPQRAVDAATLVLLTEGAGPGDAASADGRVLALPEADDVGEIPRTPDLATALRRHPGTTRLRVLGAGLPARDREAARGLDIAFEPLPPTPGLVELQLPARVVRGAGFAVAGRVAGDGERVVELLDPAGRRVDAVAPDADGRFQLRGVAMEAGAARFALRLADAGGGILAQLDVPLWIEADVPPRVLLLAGAPGPETRALRRWLVDAGARVDARIALGGGLHLGTAALDAGALAQADLVIADARAWSGLGETARARVLAAVDAGLGLLLRADTAMGAAALRDIRGPGFEVGGGSGSRVWTLPPPRLDDEQALRAWMGSGRPDAPFDLEQAQAAVPQLSRRDWRVQGAQAVALGQGVQAPAGWWRARGRGRIGLWTLLDTYVLPLHGREDLYAGLWNEAVATLARAGGEPLPAFAAAPRAGQRSQACGWPEGAVVEAPDGRLIAPVADPASGDRRCAGFWPRVEGWHRLRHGERERWFHVAAADADPTLRLAELREATLALAAAAPDAAARARAAAAPGVPGPAWPWFVLWLALAGAAWWLERSRRGLRAVATP